MVALLLAALGLPGSAQEVEPRLLLEWGAKGDKPGEFHSPIGLALGPADEVVVTDCNNARLQRFDAEGKHRGGFALPPDDPKRPTQCLAGGVAVDVDGRIYLSFMGQHKIRVHEADGTLLREWGSKGAGLGEFNQPGGIAFGPGGTLLVADQGNHRIQVFTKEGRVVEAWGGHGTEPGTFGGTEKAGSRFAGPHFLSVDAEGRIFTTEGGPGRIQRLTAGGRPLTWWGSLDPEPGGFGAAGKPYHPGAVGPIGVLADRHGRVWVSSLNDRVQCYTAEGRYLMGIGGLSRPHGLAFDRAGHLYVADAGAQRIRKYLVPGPGK